MTKDTTKKIIQIDAYTKFIRWINFLGLGIILLFSLPSSIVKIFDLNINIRIRAANLMYLAFYISIFFSFWVFIIFTRLEVKISKKKNMNFNDHITSNWLVLWGFLIPCILFFNMFI